MCLQIRRRRRAASYIRAGLRTPGSVVMIWHIAASLFTSVSAVRLWRWSWLWTVVISITTAGGRTACALWSCVSVPRMQAHAYIKLTVLTRADTLSPRLLMLLLLLLGSVLESRVDRRTLYGNYIAPYSRLRFHYPSLCSAYDCRPPFFFFQMSLA